MQAILEWSQQFFSLFIILWPIWVVFIVGGVLGKKFKNAFLLKLSKLSFIGIGALLLIIRLVIFAVFPYGNIAEEYSFSLPKDSSKIVVIDHQYGELRVSYETSNTFKYAGKDLRGMKQFKENKVFFDEKSGGSTEYEAIHFDSFSAVPIVGAVNSQTKLIIPETVTQNLFITFQEADVVIDLSRCSAKKIQILSAYSKLRLILPTVAINQEINLVTRVSDVSIEYVKDVPVRLLDEMRLVNKKWDDFDNVDGRYYEYLRKDFSRDIPVVTVNMSSATQQLVLKQISGHND